VKFKLGLDGKEHAIEALPGGKVSVDGEPVEVGITKPSGDRRLVRVGERSYELRILEGDGEPGAYLLELGGERLSPVASDVVAQGGGAAAAPRPAPSPAEQPAAGEAAAASAPGQEGVQAPMPGKIVDVLVKQGDNVEAGQIVAILEAMKMENEVHSPRKGLVTAVLVKKGDHTDRGQLLVAFGPTG
jgi:biotin carboxyl carrier protein